MDKDKLVIDIYLVDEDPFRSFFAPDEYRLSAEIEDYILSKFTNNLKKEVELNFINSSENLYAMKIAVSNTFSDRINSVEHEFKANHVKAIVLFILGFLFGFLFSWISETDFKMFAAMISIISWVLIWSGTEIYFFKNLQIRGFINKCESVLEAKINVK